MENETYLITGGCGFIGTSLITALRDRQPALRIRVLDSLVTGSLQDLSEACSFQAIDAASPLPEVPGVYFTQGDIRDTAVAQSCGAGANTIIHLAANTGVGVSVDNPRLDMRCNVIGTLNMLESARVNGISKFVFASSGAPAGEVELPIHEELPPHPVSPYGASKLAGEGYCSAYFRTFGIDTVCLRFGNVFGPRSAKKTSVVSKFMQQALAGEVCEIYGDGSQTRDFIYIDDLIKAMLLCLEKNPGGETFQIASGREHTIQELAEAVAGCLAGHGVAMRIAYGPPRLGDVQRNFSDTAKAARVLGWKPETTLSQGLEKTAAYFLASSESGYTGSTATPATSKKTPMTTQRPAKPAKPMKVIYLSDKYKLAFCAVAKAASTSIVDWLAKLEGIDPSAMPEVYKERPYLPRAAFDLMRSHLVVRTYKAISSVLSLNDFFYFTIVRNPYTRIFSAWQNKVLLHPVKRLHSFKIFDDSRDDSRTYLSIEDIKESFEKFLYKLHSTNNFAGFDRHVAPQTSLIDLDSSLLIVKLEDSGILNNRLRAWAGDDMPLPLKQNVGPYTILKYHPSFFSKDAVRIIQELYQDDFQTLHYDIEPPESASPENILNIDNDLAEIQRKRQINAIKSKRLQKKSRRKSAVGGQ